MEDIIPAVSKQLILKELTPERCLRSSNKANNEIYVVDAHVAPNVMRELGRLREIAFRQAGGGTGKACDIDEYDLMDPPCRQLIVWDPENQAIVGGYRFILGKDIRFKQDGSPRIATSHMFRFSPKFITDILPYTIELGRSFVNTEYQASGHKQRAIFALDNLWDGLGALTVIYPEIKYLFGKVTMYPTYGPRERDLILCFLKKYFPDPENLVAPFHPLESMSESEEISGILSAGNFKDDYKILHSEIRKADKNIPPLINSYLALSPTMRMFGTAVNDEFGNVEESAILLKLSDIFEEKKKRHIGSFVNNNHL